MNKLTLFLFLVVVLFLAGCEAFTMPPDAWLHPPRWEQEEMAKAQQKYSERSEQALQKL